MKIRSKNGPPKLQQGGPIGHRREPRGGRSPGQGGRTTREGRAGGQRRPNPRGQITAPAAEQDRPPPSQPSTGKGEGSEPQDKPSKKPRGKTKEEAGGGAPNKAGRRGGGRLEAQDGRQRRSDGREEERSPGGGGDRPPQQQPEARTHHLGTSRRRGAHADWRGAMPERVPRALD